MKAIVATKSKEGIVTSILRTKPKTEMIQSALIHVAVASHIQRGQGDWKKFSYIGLNKLYEISLLIKFKLI